MAQKLLPAKKHSSPWIQPFKQYQPQIPHPPDPRIHFRNAGVPPAPLTFVLVPKRRNMQAGATPPVAQALLPVRSLFTASPQQLLESINRYNSHRALFQKSPASPA
jgi:hypothetical protein